MHTCYQKDKIYLIFGTGITGKSAISFCQKHNLKYYIACDNQDSLKNLTINNKKIEEENKLYEYDKNILKKIKIDYLVLSPSVHAQYQPHEIVKIANELHIEIIPDVDLFYCYLQEYNVKHNTNKKIVGITGTNGKSTTTALVAFLFNSFNKKAIACGNIGLNELSIDIEKYDIFVIEMSSYNLFLMKYCKFDCGVLLNISEDHLIYHETIENYANAKEKIIANSKYGIICIDDNYTEKIFNNHQNAVCISLLDKKTDGYYFNENKFYKNKNIIFEGDFPDLIGLHNIQNIFCSVVCVFQMYQNIDIKDIFFAVKNFKGLPHRNQFVKNIFGIDFYNDSKGTNADSTQKALRSFKNRPIYLIAGGQRKTAGFNFLKYDLDDVKKVFLIGEATESFAKELDELNIQYQKCQVIKNAVENAFKEAQKDRLKNAVVLLSPLCASWDQYSSFEERGNDFIKIVNTI